MEAMPFIDFLFGNETEAAAFAASEGWSEKDLPTIAQKIAAFPKASGRRCRTVVITHGSKPTVIAHNSQARHECITMTVAMNASGARETVPDILVCSSACL